MAFSCYSETFKLLNGNALNTCKQLVRIPQFLVII